jgi:predicted nucleotide-binding protein
VTPDHLAQLRDELRGESDLDFESVPTAKPRPNVLFEAGMAFGRNPGRTVIVTMGRLRPISDLEGRNVVRLDNGPEKRRELEQLLQKEGCEVDITGADWLDPGASGNQEPTHVRGA